MNLDVSKLAPYAKAVGAFMVGLAGFATVAVAAFTDGRLSATEIVSLVAALGTWLGSAAVVYQIPNKPVPTDAG